MSFRFNSIFSCLVVVSTFGSAQITLSVDTIFGAEVKYDSGKRTYEQTTYPGRDSIYYVKNNPDQKVLQHRIFVSEITSRILNDDSSLTIMEIHPNSPEFNKITTIKKHEGNPEFDIILYQKGKKYQVIEDTNQYFIEEECTANDSANVMYYFYLSNCNIYDNQNFCKPYKAIKTTNGKVNTYYYYIVYKSLISYDSKEYVVQTY